MFNSNDVNMKYLFNIIFVLLFILSGCTDTMEMVDTVLENSNNSPELSTRVTTTGWENCTRGYLPCGKEIFLPWYESTMTVIPDEIRNDISGRDGWRILDSTIDFIGYDMKVRAVDDTCNYLLMYNVNTGVLKGFYYMEEETNNNCGFWNLKTSQPTKLFNFAEYYAVPASEFGPQAVTIANLGTNAQTLGFEKGWNCFMIELAYDENSYQQKLNISGFAMNRTIVTLTGAYQGKSSGTIVTSTHSSTNPVKGVATALGKAGAQWIMDNIGEDKPIKPAVLPKADATTKGISEAIKDITEKGVSGLISNGIQRVFGSLLGIGNKTSITTSDLMFTTNGEATISGEMTTPVSGIISPITGLTLGTEEMNLGVWNLETVPELIVDPIGKLSQISKGKFFFYDMHAKTSAILKMNPIISQPYGITVTPVCSNTAIINAEPYIKGNKQVEYDIWSEPQGQLLYKDDIQRIETCPLSYRVYCEQWPNFMLNDDKGSVAVNFSYTDNKYDLTRAVSFKVLCSQYSAKVYSSKTFTPLQKYGYVLYSGRPHFSWTTTDFKNQHIPEN